jgi:hypothetical protein
VSTNCRSLITATRSSLDDNSGLHSWQKRLFYLTPRFLSYYKNVDKNEHTTPHKSTVATSVPANAKEARTIALAEIDLVCMSDRQCSECID